MWRTLFKPFGFQVVMIILNNGYIYYRFAKYIDKGIIIRDRWGSKVFEEYGGEIKHFTGNTKGQWYPI